jgi:hypothetical protein
MIRRLNYTGRKRLLREDTKIVLNERPGEAATFDASLSLNKYELPNDALVFVEAYRQMTVMRFDFGTVGNIKPPDDRRLTDFDSVEAVLFRVKVTSASSSHGKLLAEGDRIRFQRPEEQPDDRMPLLPVKPQELETEIAKLDFSGDEPLLLVNSLMGPYQEIARSPAFTALMYPQIVREILTRILIIDSHADTEDEENWRSRWLRFATYLPGVSDPPAVNGEIDEQHWDWIDEAVKAFSKQIQVTENFRRFWEGESSQ